MKRSKLSKEKYKMYSLMRKGALGSVKELNPVFKEINRLKKSLVLNGIKEIVTSEQDPAQLSL